VRQAARPTPAAALPEGKRHPKGSSVVRDIAIGVSIAAAVLALFVVIKLTVLDSPEEPAKMGALRVRIEGSGTLFVDGKTIGAFDALYEIPETTGKHQLKVTSSSGAVLCEREVELAAGETKDVDCVEANPAKAVAPVVAPDAGAPVDAAPAPDAASAAPAVDPKVAAPEEPQADPQVDPKPPAADPKASPSAAKAPPTDAKAAQPGAKSAPSDAKMTPKEDPSGAAKPDAKKPKPDPKLDKRPKAPVRPKDPGGGLPVVEDLPEPSHSYLVILTEPPGARVLLDGVDTGKKTPIGNRQRLAVAAGKRQLTLVLGRNRWDFTVTIAAGETEAVTKELRL
jgi:hypothetical protein